MELDADKINDPDRMRIKRIEAEAEAYASSRDRSRAENKRRADSRERILKSGIRTDAFQVGIKLIKDLSERERADFMDDLRLMLKTLGGKQADLFPEEAIRAAKREEKRKEEEAAKKKADGSENDNKSRSDPNKGGAKPRTKKQDAEEQAEGAAALTAGLPETKKAQSKLAAEKLEAAKLN